MDYLKDKSKCHRNNRNPMYRSIDSQGNPAMSGNTMNFITTDKSSHQRCSIKRLFLKFRIIHRKTPMLESFFNKACNFIKKGLQHRFFLVNIKNTYFEERLPTAASEPIFIC